MTVRPKIGIMQGRLSNQIGNSIQYFPESSWKEEFKKATELGFNTIEWIFDNTNNPLCNPDGRSEILKTQKKYDIKINSICADYFMEDKLFSISETNMANNVKILNELIESSAKLEIPLIEIPFVDSSSLKTDDEKKQLKNNLEKILSNAEQNNIDIALETDLNPNDFNDYLTEINHHRLFANFDSGNSASLGFNPKQELRILQKWIRNVHIKDREYSGSTVPLGTGDVDFDSVFTTLKEIDYHGDLIIQGSRIPEKTNSSEETSLTYLRFVDGYVNKYYR
jgi:L-ribulose-5-phosphate 3-epimerase